MKEESMTIKLSLLDVDEVFKKKNPRLYRFLPRFVLSYIKRIIHQDELNTCLELFKDSQGLDFVKNTLSYLGIKYTVVDEENIPRQGRYIFVGNHPLGGLDGMVLMDTVGKYFPEIRSISNDLLMNIENMRNLFIPVNKHGGQSQKYFRIIEKMYDSDVQILNFPAGLCSRKTRGRITDLEWKKSFVKKAIQHKRDIVPVYFEGKNSNFFYRLANFRKFLGIKANFEMFFLPDELFRQKGKEIIMKVGKPIPWQSLDQSKTHQQWADEIKKVVYRIGGRSLD